jgi:hypothetical protein
MRGKGPLGIVIAGALTAAVIVAAPSAAGGSPTVSKAIRLPPASGIQVSVVSVKATAPKGKHVGALKVTATNGSDLGTAQTNTQVVVAVSPKSSQARKQVFKVWVFIHRFPAAPARRQAAATDTTTANLSFKDAGDSLALGTYVESLSCDELSKQKSAPYELWAGRGKTISAHDSYNFLGDNSVHVEGKRVYELTKQPYIHLGNLVIAMDTPAEEQLDNAVFQKGCPGAEDPSDDKPPV